MGKEDIVNERRNPVFKDQVHVLIKRKYPSLLKNMGSKVSLPKLEEKEYRQVGNEDKEKKELNQSMVEQDKGELSVIPTDKVGKIRNWVELQSFLPNDISKKELKFLEAYFRIQLRVANGQMKRANELFGFLGKIKGYNDFENEHIPLLKVVDIAVKGKTRWDETVSLLR